MCIKFGFLDKKRIKDYKEFLVLNKVKDELLKIFTEKKIGENLIAAVSNGQASEKYLFLCVIKEDIEDIFNNYNQNKDITWYLVPSIKI